MESMSAAPGNMLSPKVSIIIPAYNVEKWLEKAVSTLGNQTFQDFELLIVDDGSKDGTPEIADKLAGADPRIKVIHQENAGAAMARNRAMQDARGEYIYFMDADDWAEPTMLEDMVALADANQLDLVVTGFYIDTYYDDDKFFREERTATDYVFESQELFRASAYALFDAQLLYAPWNKLYRRSYLQDNGILFPKTFWDDLPFNLDVVRDVERVGLLDGHYYHFLRARGEAENTKYRPDMYAKREEENEWLTELFEYWGVAKQPEVREFLARRYAERLLGCIENVTCADCSLSWDEKREVVRKMLDAPQARHALQVAVPGTRMLGILFANMRSGNVDLVLAQSMFISWVKRNNTNLFARLKANR